MKRNLIFVTLIAVVSLWIVVSALTSATARPTAVTVTVTTADDVITDDGLCSLREAIIAANTDASFHDCPAGSGDDTIVFSPALPSPTIITLTLTGANENGSLTGDLDISSSLTISGAGEANTLIDGNNADRVIEIFPASTVTVTGVTVRHGNPGAAVDGGGFKVAGALHLIDSTVRDNYGGGIFNQSPGSALTHVSLNNSRVMSNTTNGSGAGLFNDGAGATADIDNSLFFANIATGGGGAIYNTSMLSITASTLAGNRGQRGGGINHFLGDLYLTNSTLSDNYAIDKGGALYAASNATLLNDTLATNQADGSGAGLFIDGAALIFKNTLVALNFSADPDGNCARNGGLVNTQGYNLDGGDSCSFHATGDMTNTNPLIGPLQDNGGPTPTHALLAGSPAIDRGTNVGCPSSDQRGMLRPMNGVCDIGAYEFATFADLAVIKTANASPVLTDSPLTYTLSAINQGPLDATSVTLTDQLPAGVIFGGATGNGWACNQASNLVTCNKPAFAVTTDTVIITVTTPGAPAMITNTATITSATSDLNPSNNSSRAATIVVDPSWVELSVLKTADRNPAEISQTLTYTLHIANIGPGAAEAVTVTDQLPGDVIYGGTLADDWACDQLSGVVTCTRPSLVITSFDVIISVTTPMTPTVITNTATITSTTFDWLPGNNTATVTTDVIQFHDLYLPIVLRDS